MSACAYLPGTWTAVVCERLLALVGPGADEASVARLWDVAVAGGGVPEALNELAERTPASIALVTLSSSGTLHAALRGEVELVVGSAARAVRPDAGSRWREVTARDVGVVTVRALDGAAAADPPARSRLPLVDGVVRAAEIRVAAGLQDERRPPDETGFVEDQEGLTIVTGDLAKIRRTVPVAAAPPGAVPHAPPLARITLSTGLVVPLDRTVLLGRAPQVGRVGAGDLPRLVPVPSPQLDISRTHAEVRQEGEVVVVTDLESLNGVLVTRPGSPPRRLHPSEPTVVVPGEVVDLGDGVTFTVGTGA
jgi:hypothetical protein